MNRFFGMMPSKEIEKKGHFVETDGSPVDIDAGPHGWTVHWCDHSTLYKDVDATTEENFQEALKTANSKAPHGPLKEAGHNKRLCIKREE